MITVSKSFIHWNYFLALESDLENISRYIEFIDKNYKTYSIELAHLLLASSSENDVVLKALCFLLSPEETRKIEANRNMKIDDYREIIKANIPEFENESIYINRYGISVKPWGNWKGDKNPDWWQSYNNVKHQRDKYFDQANLKNTICSIGGLLVTCYYYYKRSFETESGKTFKPQEVTEKLQQKSNFVQLSPDFYHNFVYFDK